MLRTCETCGAVFGQSRGRPARFCVACRRERPPYRRLPRPRPGRGVLPARVPPRAKTAYRGICQACGAEFIANTPARHYCQTCSPPASVVGAAESKRISRELGRAHAPRRMLWRTAPELKERVCRACGESYRTNLQGPRSFCYACLPSAAQIGTSAYNKMWRDLHRRTSTVEPLVRRTGHLKASPHEFSAALCNQVAELVQAQVDQYEIRHGIEVPPQLLMLRSYALELKGQLVERPVHA